VPRKSKEICVRSNEGVIQRFKQFISENKLSNYGHGLENLLLYVGSEVFADYVDCDHFGEYPLDSKHFITCDKSGKSGKRVPRKREDCEKCYQYKKVRVLMQTKEKIKQENVKLEYRNANLTTEIDEKRKELKNIENLANMPEQLKEKNKEIARLLRRLEDREKIPPSVLDVEKKLSEQERSIPESQNEQVDNQTPIEKPISIERTIQEKTTTEKVFFQNNQPNRMIICPIKTKQVDIDHQECKKCQHRHACNPEYLFSLHSDLNSEP
jgi:hypothetical protein